MRAGLQEKKEVATSQLSRGFGLCLKGVQLVCYEFELYVFEPYVLCDLTPGIDEAVCLYI